MIDKNFILISLFRIMKMKTLFFFIMGIFVCVAFLEVKAKDYQNQYLANNNVENLKENETSTPADNSKEIKEEVSVAPKIEKPIPNQNAEECANTLNTKEKDLVLLALASCASKNKDKQKVQSALLNLMQNSQDETIIKLSLLLLSNQKNQDIPKGIINALKEKESFKNPKLQYIASIVLYSNLNEEIKSEAKQIYETQQISEDELLKNLSENVLKKLNK